LGEGKLQSKWKGLYIIINTSSHGAITIQDDEGNTFKVNDQCLKVFLEPSYNFNEKIDIIKLIDFNKYPNKSASKIIIINKNNNKYNKNIYHISRIIVLTCFCSLLSSNKNKDRYKSKCEGDDTHLPIDAQKDQHYSTFGLCIFSHSLSS
jgi:hypothetical protein